MSNIFEFWQRVKACDAQLPAGPAFWMLPFSDRAELVEVNREGAAELLARGHARLATAAELDAHRSRMGVLCAPELTQFAPKGYVCEEAK